MDLTKGKPKPSAVAAHRNCLNRTAPMAPLPQQKCVLALVNGFQAAGIPVSRMSEQQFLLCREAVTPPPE